MVTVVESHFGVLRTTQDHKFSMITQVHQTFTDKYGLIQSFQPPKKTCVSKSRGIKFTNWIKIKLEQRYNKLHQTILSYVKYV